MVLDRLVDGDARGAADGRDRGQRGTSEPECEAEDEGQSADDPADAGPAELGAHELHQPVADRDPDPDADRGADRPEHECGTQVARCDGAWGASDRLHHADLAGLLANDGVHRGEDDDEGGHEGDACDRVEHDDEVPDVLRAGPGAGTPHLEYVPVGDVGELVGEDRAQLGHHRVDRRGGRILGQDVDRVRRRVPHDPLHVGAREVEHGGVVGDLAAVAHGAAAAADLERLPPSRCGFAARWCRPPLPRDVRSWRCCRR